ncbi:MAG: hypothetical protein LC800_17865 [Acidobacteria bacterium]|nr:hypothetical protein [Acidobacteriota bacterium]
MVSTSPSGETKEPEKAHRRLLQLEQEGVRHVELVAAFDLGARHVVEGPHALVGARGNSERRGDEQGCERGGQ